MLYTFRSVKQIFLVFFLTIEKSVGGNFCNDLVCLTFDYNKSNFTLHYT